MRKILRRLFRNDISLEENSPSRALRQRAKMLIDHAALEDIGSLSCRAKLEVKKKMRGLEKMLYRENHIA
jgi:hypothetical protein